MTTPTDTAKLADEIEALAKDATPTPWFQWPTKDGGRVCASFPVEGEEPLSIADFDMDQRLDYDTTSCANAALVSRLSQSLPTIIAALRELDAVKAREATDEEIEKAAARMHAHLNPDGAPWPIFTELDPQMAHRVRGLARAALGGAG